MTPSVLAHIAALCTAFWAVLLASVGYLTGHAGWLRATACLAVAAVVVEALAVALRGVRVSDRADP